MTFVEYVAAGVLPNGREVRRASGDINDRHGSRRCVFTMLGFNIVLASFDVVDHR
jgi:hypothetical protein